MSSLNLKNISILTCIMLAGLLVTPISGQTEEYGLRFDYNIRYRFEAWNGMNQRNYGDDRPEAIGNLDDKILFQRLIAGFTWEHSKSLLVAIHMQDSRAFGWSLRHKHYPELFRVKAAGTSEPFYTMNPDEQYLELYDAYIVLSNIWERIRFTIGRQKISYGDNRIFGPGEWGNTGRWTWDALKISYKADKHFIDLFFGGTKIHDPVSTSIPFSNTEFWGGGIYAHIHNPQFAHIEPFYAYKSQGSAPYINQRDINRHWAGLRLFKSDRSNIAFDATLARQFGNDEEKSVAAYGLYLMLGYKFQKVKGNPLLSIRRTYASGGTEIDSKIRTFEPAFGANDRYYGRMNIVSWSNLDNPEVALELKPSDNLWIEITYNWFLIPNPENYVRAGTLSMLPGEHHLGNELNVFAQYQLTRQLQGVGAFGYFVPGDVKPINGKKPASVTWFAVQLLFEL